MSEKYLRTKQWRDNFQMALDEAIRQKESMHPLEFEVRCGAYRSQIEDLDEQLKRKEKNMEDKFKTVCPYCGEDGKLVVIQITLTYHNNRVIETYADLDADGFDYWDDVPARMHNSDLSTQDEQVKCKSCKKIFPLGEVFIEESI